MQDIVTFHQPPTIKCLDLWFESGDVVVVAGYVAFRVHRDVLSDNSTVLADMLSSLAASEESNQEELDGCPVVRLKDSVHDVKHLLRMLYNGIDRDDGIEPIRPAACTDLTSEARMAHKYKLHTRKESYSALRHHFPSTFASWEALDSEGLRLSASDAIEAINLFRAIGDDDSTTPHMLVALYLASGCTLPDGVLETLRGADVERCVLLREALLERSAWMAAQLFAGGASADCRGAEGVCDARIAETRAAVLYGDADEWMHADALGESMRSWIDGMELEKGRGICGICAGMLCERDRELRRELWEEMPALLARVEEEMRGARGGHDEDEEWEEN
ncbi:hypothetical protein GSI_11264 [Ganoderma sinense ZZ0214-1]|uniref:BTB domain-containing protein n=1 Tax=Ganoderma sinense ZZ0214-1 TaxID=1077348 RepID=A0A2G8RYN5_9APHY|nr:hypothetical protein GSI_11264 [Ganoderma sinense ZZ0214-1]